MEKNLAKTNNQKLDELCERVYHGSQKWVRVALKDLISYKVWLGYTVSTSEVYRKYGQNLVEMVAERTGVGKDVIYEAVKMFELEKLTTPNKQRAFIKRFLHEYESWNEYLEKVLGSRRKISPTRNSDECNHCPKHCP